MQPKNPSPLSIINKICALCEFILHIINSFKDITYKHTDRPFNMKKWVGCGGFSFAPVRIVFSRRVRNIVYIFWTYTTKIYFFQNLTLFFYTKIMNQNIFYPHFGSQNNFFPQNSASKFRKKTIAPFRFNGPSLMIKLRHLAKMY